jgi:hypothetical protein
MAAQIAIPSHTAAGALVSAPQHTCLAHSILLQGHAMHVVGRVRRRHARRLIRKEQMRGRDVGSAQVVMAVLWHSFVMATASSPSFTV